LPARIDPQVPVEESVRALTEYVKAGKIGGYGLCELVLRPSDVLMLCTPSRPSRSSCRCSLRTH
jgi:hypothetical protein